MKKIIFILTLLICSKIYAESVYNGIQLNKNNCEKLGFQISITQNSYQKNCYNITVNAPYTDNEKYDFGYGQVLINEGEKSILNIRPSISDNNGKKYFQIMIDKDQFKKLSINIIYLQPRKPIHDKKRDVEIFVACGPENSYELNLVDFKKD
jgi:hypothetical protein